MRISNESASEIRNLAESDSLKSDMRKIASQKHNPFFKQGTALVDEYVEFVTQFNEFINHRPRPFKKIIDREMRL